MIINAKQDGSKIIIKAKLINPQAYETDKELGTTKTKQNKTIKQKNKILTKAKLIDVRDFSSASHINNKETWLKADKPLLPYAVLRSGFDVFSQA